MIKKELDTHRRFYFWLIVIGICPVIYGLVKLTSSILIYMPYFFYWVLYISLWIEAFIILEGAGSMYRDFWFKRFIPLPEGVYHLPRVVYFLWAVFLISSCFWAPASLLIIIAVLGAITCYDYS